jgi:hypothetical protein
MSDTETTDWKKALEVYFLAVFEADHIIADPAYLDQQCGLDLPPEVMSWLRDLYAEQTKGWEPLPEDRRG